jgi:hypothetical protein
MTERAEKGPQVGEHRAEVRHLDAIKAQPGWRGPVSRHQPLDQRRTQPLDNQGLPGPGQEDISREQAFTVVNSSGPNPTGVLN